MSTLREALKEKIRSVLKDGFLVAVVGWRPSNHSPWTSRLPEEKVRFFFRLPRMLPQRAGIVLFTRFIEHKEFERARKWRMVHPFTLQIGEIKQILSSARELLVSPEARPIREEEVIFVTPKREEKKPEAVPVHVPPAAPVAARPIETRPELKFARAFLEATGPDPDARLGKTTVGRLVRETMGSGVKTQELVRAGWLESIKATGKMKTGWYKPGPKMLEAHTRPEPTDPLERAKWIISHEADLARRKQELEAELGRINQDLEKVHQAKELLRKLEELMK